MVGIGEGLRVADLSGLVVDLGEVDGPVGGIDEKLARRAAGFSVMEDCDCTTGRVDVCVGNGNHAGCCKELEKGASAFFWQLEALEESELEKGGHT